MDDGLPDMQALSGLAASALGCTVTVTDVHRLRGGTRKGVHRLGLDDGSSVVLYLWREEEDWWRTVREHEPHPDDPLGESSGLSLFAAAHRELSAAGVLVPQILLLDDSRSRLAADVALVQDVAGGSLEDLIADDAGAAQPVLVQLAQALRAMEAVMHPTFGKVHEADRPKTLTFPQVVLQRALVHVESASRREPRIRAVADHLREELHTRAVPVSPRTGFSLVHGELGPDHVRVDEQGRPVLVDIEGLMWAEAEWEHAFLELRFADHYGVLRSPGLDQDRLRLYRLAFYISLVEGPLRLLETGFPHPEGMRTIAEANLARALATLGSTQ